MKLKHKSSCDCVECEWSRVHQNQEREKKERRRQRIHKKLGIQYRRETLGRLIEQGWRSMFYNDKQKEFMFPEEDPMEWIRTQIKNSEDAHERWVKRQ